MEGQQNTKLTNLGKDDSFWENLGINFTIPSEEDFDEILEFYRREFVPGTF